LFVLITALIGVVVALSVFINFVPKTQKNTFVLASILGSGVGILIWFFWLGPILLP
jgi:hypothetical protein